MGTNSATATETSYQHGHFLPDAAFNSSDSNGRGNAIGIMTSRDGRDSLIANIGHLKTMREKERERDGGEESAKSVHQGHIKS